MADLGEFFIGVDIGGTKVAAGLVNTTGEILLRTRNPIKTTGSADEALSAVRQAIDSVLSQSGDKEISSIGLSAPGTVDLASGTVLNPSNLPCWHNYPLGPAIHEIYHLPAQVHNDGNAAGLAEALWGAGSGYKSVFYATIGTGVGTALLYRGHLYLGRTRSAGEGGHMVIDYRGPQCHCGKFGCIETFAAGPAIARRAQETIKTGGSRGEAILSLAGGNLDCVKSETVARAWEQGDPLATQILEETADILAIWFGNIIDLIEPDVIVVGGGMSGLIARWFDRILSQLPRWSVNTHCHEVPLLSAKYGPDSGIVGAAALCVSRGTYL